LNPVVNYDLDSLSLIANLERNPFKYFVKKNFFTENFSQKLHEFSLSIPVNLYQNHDSGYKYAPFLNSQFYSFIYSDYFFSFMKTIYSKEIIKSSIYKYPQIYKIDSTFSGLLPHTDFNQNRDFTAIFYLAKNWIPLCEGELIVYEKDLISSQFKIDNIIKPQFNTFVTFEISQQSWHSVKKVKNDWLRLAVVVDFDLKKNLA
jgi:2OG-Fe(II) oxygenase superfamily